MFSFFLWLTRCLLDADVAALTVPEAPAAAAVTPYSGTDLHLNFTPPLADGGSQVTSYKVEWDDNNGVLEVQTLQTLAYTGANEVQTVTSFCPDINEVQSFNTRATNVYEVQAITTYANHLETLNGSFTLAFDTTATGGGLYITASISNAALPSRGVYMGIGRVGCCGWVLSCSVLRHWATVGAWAQQGF